MKIYTKTGDAGQTGLVGGSRIDKDSDLITAIGDIDELNAQIGVVRTCSTFKALDLELQQIQNLLFDIGAELATPAKTRFNNTRLGERHIRVLEESIDRQTTQLPELTSFILPGGCEFAAHLHLARAVCRRAERLVIALHKQSEIRDEIRFFLNRLSDWLFVAARTANFIEHVQDIAWQQVEN